MPMNDVDDDVWQCGKLSSNMNIHLEIMSKSKVNASFNINKFEM